MSDLQGRDQKNSSALIRYTSPLLHMTPCDVVDVKVELNASCVPIDIALFIALFTVGKHNVTAVLCSQPALLDFEFQ